MAEVNYIGMDAAKELYKRNKRMIDDMVAKYEDHDGRIGVIERDAANVQRITEKVVHQITGNEVTPTINYIE